MRSSNANRRRFLGASLLASFGLASRRATGEEAIRNGLVHNGIPVMADLDPSLRIKNTGGTDGAGLCVWASLTMGARWHNCPELSELFAAMQHERGGGWPERVDEKMRQYAPKVRYEQYVGSKLDFVQRHVRKGRIVCATYGYGELYEMQTISHMICVVYLDEQQAAILDNNDPGHIWWMSRAEYHKRAVHPSGQLWAVALHLPPPPPVPHNRTT